ncbi:MAG: transglycosylase SLT domain-containing protein [bacterium]|nr:transglycosylase SLT domain-containing protein [bacterium]
MKSICFAVLCFAIYIGNLQAVRGETETNKPLKGWEKSAVEVGIPRVLNEYRDEIQRASKVANLPGDLVASIVVAESMGDKNARSKTGAEGLMQISREIDGKMGIRCDAQEPKCSIKKGACYLAILVNRYKITLWLDVTLAYRYGPEGASRIENPADDPYVKKILFVLNRLPEGAFEPS